MELKIGVVGLGYVGLPVALAFARKFPGTVGFDIDARKVRELASGFDSNGETSSEELKASTLKFTANPSDLKGCNFYVVAVPTPVDQDKRPDMSPLESASELVGKVMAKGAVVCYESTVYPGVTEDICGPVLEKFSGLKQGRDFKLGYSPERINPGDHEHTLERIVKVVSGEDPETLNTVAFAYGAIITAGVHKASSIKVAEAAKVIENTQRDLNIALMNELAIIFDRMNISTKEVLAASATKWNFLKFGPGLVGGHCIGVDPYYLTTKAEQLGYHPEVILAGRKINDGMGVFIAQRMVKLMINSGIHIKDARVGVLGLTFKENVSDLRNSRMPDILAELKQFGVSCVVHDAMADAQHAVHEYGVQLSPLSEFKDLDGIVLAVSHKDYLAMNPKTFCEMMKPEGVFIDVKAAFNRSAFSKNIAYWAL